MENRTITGPYHVYTVDLISLRGTPFSVEVSAKTANEAMDAAEAYARDYHGREFVARRASRLGYRN